MVFLFLLCFIAHSYEANGGTDMEVLACFRPCFYRLGVFMPVVLTPIFVLEKDAVSWRPISLLFHGEKITHESDVQILHFRCFLSGYRLTLTGLRIMARHKHTGGKHPDWLIKEKKQRNKMKWLNGRAVSF